MRSTLFSRKIHPVIREYWKGKKHLAEMLDELGTQREGTTYFIYRPKIVGNPSEAFRTFSVGIYLNKEEYEVLKKELPIHEHKPDGKFTTCPVPYPVPPLFRK